MIQEIFLVLPLLTFMCLGFVPVLIDIREHRLPNQLTFRLSAILFSVLTFVSVTTSDWAGWLPMFICIGYVCAAYVLLFLLGRSALGFGDVKFAIPCAAIIGWYAPSEWLLYLWISFGLAAVTAMILWGTGKANRTSAIAFGPFMYLAVILVGAKAILSG